jgi:hypothetical protein
MSPLQGTFFLFEEVVGLGEAWVGLQRSHVKHIVTLMMMNNLFSSKYPCVKRVAPHHHALAPKARRQAKK